jgi:hypothetical protein
MLYWLFATYRESVAVFVAIPLLVAGMVMPVVTAYALGQLGKKVARHGLGHRERRLIALTLLVVALAVAHLLLLLGGKLAIDHTTPTDSSLALTLLIGPPGLDWGRLLIATGTLVAGGGLAALGVYTQIQDGGRLRELVNRLRDPLRRREELGSAHFCYPGDFVRLQKPKGEYELRLLGSFYGKRGRGERPDRFYRLDRGPNRNNRWPWIALGVEDQARGMGLIGPAGTGKTQAGILPVTADSMKAGQSLIVLDPQGELLPYVLDYARVTGHRVIVHDPTDPSRPRFNLAHGVATVSDAQAVARVLVSGPGGGDFWSKSAQNLLAGCLLRFDSLGAILRAFDDMAALAETLTQVDDGAANVSRAFAASVKAGDRSAPGVLATLQASTLSAWAEPAVQQATAATDFTAEDIVETPTVLVLKCPGRYMKVYGPYLGAVLQRLMLDLDAIGAGVPGGALPRPVKIVIDEFPVMGRLDGIVEAVNLFRKRHISILLAAQTLSQFEMVYGRPAAEALIAGLATLVVFGSCDAATAQFVSRSLGKTTERIRSRVKRGDGTPYEPQVRQRDLMSVDEVVTPPEGNCTIIYRYATTTYATQVVVLASLTYMFQREDWQQAITQAQGVEPMIVETPLFKRRESAAQGNEKHGLTDGQDRLKLRTGSY